MDELFEESWKEKMTIDKLWLKSTHMKGNKSSVRQNVSDKEFEEIRDSVKGMRNSNKFSEYKKHFNKFCSAMKIPSTHIIITKYQFVKGKENKNTIIVYYSANRKKVIIPADSALYHISKVGGIKQLEPTFKGKSERGYLYDMPRVYLTLKKNMPKIMADYTGNTEMHKYRVMEDISTVYVDPLIWMPWTGAVFIETNHPVRVQELKPEKQSVKKENTEDMETNNSFTSLQEFCEAYGLIPIDDDEDIYTESLGSTIGEYVRKIKSTEEIKKSWNSLAEKFQKKWVKKKINNDAEKEKLKKAYEVVCKENVDYSDYKKSFAIIAKFMNLTPNDIILEAVQFNKEDNNDYLTVRYAKGKQKVIIPNGTCLVHVSPVPNLTVLKPSFKSKTSGKYMYPSKRVFFTLKKAIKPTKSGLENTTTYKYTPKESITVAYIDPSYTDFATGSVYVECNQPIRVIPFWKKMQILDQLKMESVNDLKISIYESEASGKISAEERALLIDKLNTKYE